MSFYKPSSSSARLAASSKNREAPRAVKLLMVARARHADAVPTARHAA
jgi:hypothetical protein